MSEITFPPELNVKIGAKEIEVDIDQKLLTSEVTKFLMDNQPAGNKVIIKPKPKTKMTRIICGVSAERRLEYLLALLKKTGLYSDPGTLSFPRKTLMMMDKRVTATTTQEELDAMTDFKVGIFLNFKPQDTEPRPEELNADQITVGPCTAAFFLSSFGREKDVEKMEDTFDDEGQPAWTIALTMPTLFYAALKHNMEDNTYVFSFADSETVKASDIKDMFLHVIENMKKCYCLKATLKDSDPVAALTLKEIAEKHNFFVAAFQEIEDAEDDLARSYIYLFSKNGEADKEKMKETFQEMFKKFSVRMCKKCKLVFCDENEVCCKYHHKGYRIEFPDSGMMEEVDPEEDDENGEPIVYYNYTCCGEVPKDEPGCVSEPNGKHEPDNSKQISSIEIGEEPVVYDMKF